MSDSRRTKQDEEERESQTSPAEVLGLGLNVVAASFLFGFLGHWVGTRFGGSGVRDALTLLGGFIGAIAGFYSMIRHLTSRFEQPKKKKSG